MDQNLYNVVILVMQGITILVTAITLIANLNSAKKENAKKRMVEITIKHRLQEMTELKTLSAKYLTYLNTAIASALPKDEYLLKLVSSYNDIASILKVKYEQDKILLQEMETANALAIRFVQTKDQQLQEKLTACANKLYRLFSVYAYANWVCIKEQAYGNELKSVDYRRVYEDNYPHFFED